MYLLDLFLVILYIAAVYFAVKKVEAWRGKSFSDVGLGLIIWFFLFGPFLFILALFI